MSEALHKNYPGLNRHRLKDAAFNRREVAFAVQWKRLARGNFLAKVLDPNYSGSSRLAFVSYRDKTVAATIIQWLGSPVGQAFLRDVEAEIDSDEKKGCVS